MDNITKAMLFGGKAIVSVVDITDTANHAIRIHELSDACGEALSRTLAYTAFLSAGMKGASVRLSITIDGDGKFGKIVTAGMTGGLVRGMISNPRVELPITGGKRDMSVGIGKGTMTVIKDFGLKDPYSGKIELARGDIDGDFAYYFAVSEQLNTFCLSGADILNGKCAKAGLIVVQSMPNCDENTLFVLEDIVNNNFRDVAETLKSKTAEEIIDYNFGHFECKILDKIHPKYLCVCSREKIEQTVRSLGEKEARTIIDERGFIEVLCDFCNTYYRISSDDADRIFKEL